MKMLRNLLFVPLMAVFLIACGGESSSGSQESIDHDDHQIHQESEIDKSGPEYTSLYICPMHCEGSGSDEPGECPVCGMDYVPNEDI